ncbi:MAG: hypothetical protein RBS68_06980 [Anaerolineales bacterium]|jgi:hypothetical protein|nr:hypothetical protein [Anaerolineales bacterium]
MTRDLRKYTSQTNLRLLLGIFFLFFVVGIGLIWLIYGLPAAIFGLLCLLGALVPVGLIWFFMFGLDWIVKRANRD